MSISVKSWTATAGLGFPRDSFDRAMEWGPDVIACQGTSTDPGPYYHGTTENHLETMTLGRDLDLMMTAAKKMGIPFISSLGGGGSNSHLENNLKVIDEIARDRGPMRVAVIRSELPKEHLKELIRSGTKIPRITAHERLSEYLTEADVDRAVKVVAQMGPEPMLQALDMDVDAVITGRAVDIAVLAAYPMKRGIPKATAMFAGKIMECNATAAEPGTPSDIICGEITESYFDVFAANPALRCTPISVAGHSVYERHNAILEENPGGILYIDDATYTALDERTVRVAGGRWVDMPYTVKLEAAKSVGFRSIDIAGIRDDITIANLDEILNGARKSTTAFAVDSGFAQDDFRITFRVYGRDAIMGAAEPVKRAAHEVCVITDVVAVRQELAHRLCGFIKTGLGHWGFAGRRTTANNVAFPFSPMDFDLGEVFAFNIWHALPLEDPCSLFPLDVVDFPRKGR
jgi:hypothetical protein